MVTLSNGAPPSLRTTAPKPNALVLRVNTGGGGGGCRSRHEYMCVCVCVASGTSFCNEHPTVRIPSEVGGMAAVDVAFWSRNLMLFSH